MKKVLFSALAYVAFAGSGFAANEIVVETPEIGVENTFVSNENSNQNETARVEKLSDGGDCTYSITYTDRNGNRVTVNHSSQNVPSALICANKLSIEVKKLESEGARVTAFISKWE